MSENSTDGSNIADLIRVRLESFPAADVTEVTTTRIKFYFWPSRIVHFVDHNATFRCYIKWDGKYWRLKRYHLPVNYQMRIFKLFWDPRRFAVTDDNIVETISKIYRYLCEWSLDHEKWRLDRFQRYKAGEDVEIDSIDENLFLTNTERKLRKIKLRAIWKRML